ncbi:MAG: DUF2752 domain-containing protein [Armatimonadota bacterium]
MWRALLLIVAVGVVWGSAYVLQPYVERAPTVCTFRIVTGKPCPTCGMTRATCALAHGEWAKAWRHHPMAIPFWAALVGLLWTYLVLPAQAQVERWRRLSLQAFLVVVATSLVWRIGEWIR